MNAARCPSRRSTAAASRRRTCRDAFAFSSRRRQRPSAGATARRACGAPRWRSAQWPTRIAAGYCRTRQRGSRTSPLAARSVARSGPSISIHSASPGFVGLSATGPRSFVPTVSCFWSDGLSTTQAIMSGSRSAWIGRPRVATASTRVIASIRATGGRLPRRAPVMRPTRGIGLRRTSEALPTIA